jgi:UTP-glucose-1-phosphate uridylyltransferase
MCAADQAFMVNQRGKGKHVLPNTKLKPKNVKSSTKMGKRLREHFANNVRQAIILLRIVKRIASKEARKREANIVVARVLISNEEFTNVLQDATMTHHHMMLMCLLWILMQVTLTAVP